MNLFVWEVAALSNPASVLAGAGMPYGKEVYLCGGNGYTAKRECFRLYSSDTRFYVLSLSVNMYITYLKSMSCDYLYMYSCMKLVLVRLGYFVLLCWF